MFKTASVVAIFAVAMSSPVSAAPQKMTDDLLDQVVAGTYICPPSSKVKGNNGWGNGADGTNPGSFKGATSASKIAGANLTSANRINTNPTMSSGR
jgi:hypothetical protein